jgi:colicin import membrane protein
MIAVMLCLPLTGMAQNVWEKPDIQEEKKAETNKKESSEEDPKYLEGAVPVVNGEVCWTLDLPVPGKSAQQIYDIVLNYLFDLTKQENQLEGSAVSLVNKQEHKIAAHIREWLVFKDQFLSLDRTKFHYTLIAECTNNHLKMDMRRISYRYEEERSGGGSFFKAEDWITDDVAMNKKKTKLYKDSGKFRRKTIDRKDYLFESIKNALQ